MQHIMVAIFHFCPKVPTTKSLPLLTPSIPSLVPCRDRITRNGHNIKLSGSERTQNTATRSASQSRVSDSEDDLGATSNVEEGGGRRSAAAITGISAGRMALAQGDSTHSMHHSHNRSSRHIATEETDVWDFERLATTPLLAAAFEEYSRRALCHESVLFLSEVSR